MKKGKLNPIHPGEVLLEDFLKPMEIGIDRLAESINVDRETIAEIVDRKKSITADIALRLARFFGTSEEVWMNLQSHYDLEMARDDLQDAIASQVKPLGM